VSCPAGTTNAAGDDASGTDTACDAAPLSNARTFPHAEIAGGVVGFVASVIVAVALCIRQRRLADDRLRARLGIPTHSAPVGFPPQKPQIIIVQMSRKNLKKYESKRESKFSRNITTNPRRRRPASSPSASPLERASVKLGLETRAEN
jgi:hypothetical protein